MITREVFKVVRYMEPGLYVSAWVWPSKKVRVEYAVGKVSLPLVPGSLLMAFETERQAVKWKYRITSKPEAYLLHIFRCRAEAPREQPTTVHQTDQTVLCQRGLLEAYWSDRLEADMYCWNEIPDPERPPPGTIFCSSITPLENLDPHPLS